MLGRFFRAGALAILIAASGAGSAVAAPSNCDRACLVDLMNRWLAALPTHSAAGLPLAPNIRFTEQAAAIPVGDGLFVSATGAPTTFKITAVDPANGQVAAFTVMQQWGKPVIVAARLKVENGAITEAQHVIASELAPSSMANLTTPRQTFLDDVPKSERTSRADLLAAATSYFDSIEQDDGGLGRFAPDCTRHENGMQTSNNAHPAPSPLDSISPAMATTMAKFGAMNCADQINTHFFQYITMIRPRMLLVVDEQKGIVFAFPRFVHRGAVRDMALIGIQGVDSVPMNFGPMDLQAAELFKIRKGLIHDIEACGFLNAYMAPTGWEERYPETYKYVVTHPNTHPYPAGTSIP
jgi:hypothetical protein